MTALAPILQAGVLHRPADDPAGPAAPHTDRVLPRHPLRLLLGYVHDQTLAAAPAQLDLADSGRRWPPARSSAHLRDRQGQQRRHPQQPAGRHPLPCSAGCRPEVAPDQMATPISRVLAIQGQAHPPLHHRSATSSPAEARRASLGPRPTRRPGTGRRDHALLVLAAQTGPAGLRDHQLSPIQRRPASAPERTSYRPRQGPQVFDRCTPLTLTQHTPPAILAGGIAERSASAGGAAALHPQRHAYVRRRRRPADQASTPHWRATACPTLATKKITPHTMSAHRGDEPAPRRRRHHRYRAMARSPKAPRPPGSTCTPGHEAQGGRHRPNRPARN